LTWVAGLLVLGIVGVVVADRFVPGGLPLPLRPSRQATEVHAPESQPVKVASTTSDSAPTPSSTPEASSSALAEAPIPAPTVTEVGGRDAEAWKRIVRQAPSTLDWTGAVDGLLALAELDPTALDGSDMKAAALEASVAAGFDKARGAKLVDVLGERFGAAGVDVLYDIVTLRGGSRIATLATAVLAKPEVRARGSKAFRIAVELREAKCADKLALLDQVRADGDVRALSILSAVRSPECATAAGSCCLRDSAAVETTILELSERTRKP
jgi:hypothetical protein